MTYILKYEYYLGSLCEYANMCTHNGQFVSMYEAHRLVY